MININLLPKNTWQGYELNFKYESRCYYDLEINHNSTGIFISFVKKPFDTPVQKEFRDKLYADYWEGAQAFGVFEGKKLLACLEIWKEEWSKRLRVTELMVEQDYRRRGIGKELMNLAKSKASELNCRALFLETQSCNEKAIEFYLSQGLSLFGFDRSCYSNDDIEKREVRLELGIYL